MNIWIFLIFAFVTQETIVTNIAVIKALKVGIGWGPITLIFFICTALDIIIPYFAVNIFMAKSKNTKVGKFIEKWSHKAEKYVAKWGTVIGIGIIGVMWYIQLAAAVTAILKISLKKSFIILFIADCIWFTGVYISAIGIQSVVSDKRFTVLSAVIWIFVIVLLLRFILKKWIRL